MKHGFIAMVGAIVALGYPAFAQDETEAAPAAATAGPCEAEIYHAFDFWIGAWEVSDANGVLQGTNSITREEGGCVLLERWTSASGGTGQSYNYVDPASGNWRQVWVSAGANIDYEGGRTEEGAMKLEGTITYRGGTAFPFTGEWTPQEDGSVKQYFEQYDPETERWNPWFLGIYTKSEGDSAG